MKSLVTIAALLMFASGCSGTDEADGVDTTSRAESITRDAAGDSMGGDLTADELHTQLTLAGIQCDSPTEYVPSENELNFGMAPTHTFDCEDGLIGAAVFADEPQRVAMQDVAVEMICAFGLEMASVSDANWWISNETEEPNLEVLQRAGEAVGHSVTSENCESG